MTVFDISAGAAVCLLSVSCQKADTSCRQEERFARNLLSELSTQNEKEFAFVRDFAEGTRRVYYLKSKTRPDLVYGMGVDLSDCELLFFHKVEPAY